MSIDTSNGLTLDTEGSIRSVAPPKKTSGLKSALSQINNGLLDNNPVLVQVLGTCPTLAVTTSVENAIGMGLAATAVLMCSNLIISLLRKFIPSQVRIAAFIVIISGFVTTVELLMKAYLPALYTSLGIFIPLIVVNCIILARAEAYASKNTPLSSLVDGLAMGIGFTFALVLLGGAREILGSGTLLGYSLFGSAFKPAILFIMPPGAFIIFGFIMAGMKKFISSRETRQKLKSDKIEKEAAI